MAPSAGKRVAVPLLVLGAVFAGRAVAQKRGEAVRVVVRAAAGCPGSDAFFAQVAARTAVRPAEPSESARTLHVTVTDERGRFAGSLAIEEGGATSRARTVASSTCDDAFSALALIAALAIDPSASARASAASAPAPSDAGAPEMSAASGVAPTADASALTEAVQPTTPNAALATPTPSEPVVELSTARPDTDHPPLRRDAPSSTGDRWTVEAALDVLAAGAPLPRGRASFGRAWASGPSGSLGVSVADGYQASSVGGAHLLLVTASLEACAYRWRLSRALAFSPCIPFDGGVISVGGADVPGATSTVRPWLTVGALARAELALGGGFFVEARAGAAVPLVRDTFYFRPSTDVYSAPFVVGSGGVGAGMTFP